MVEPTEVLVELKQVKKQLKQSKEVYVFLFANYLLLCVIICVYVLLLLLSSLLLLLYAYIYSYVFPFFQFSSMFFYAFI